MKIRRLNGRLVSATYVRHVRTLVRDGGGNDDVDLYRLKDGSLVQAMSPADDGRVTPRECDPGTDHYDGHPAGR